MCPPFKANKSENYQYLGMLFWNFEKGQYQFNDFLLNQRLTALSGGSLAPAES